MSLIANIKWAWRKIKKAPSASSILWDIRNTLAFHFKKPRKNVAFLTNFPVWKRAYTAEFLKSQGFEAVYFYNLKSPLWKVKKRLKNQIDPTVVIWGMRANAHLLDIIEQQSLPVFRMEDGFVRSVGLGAKHIRPLSFVLDKSGWLYFDATHPNGLEAFLSKHQFSQDELNLARQMIDKILRLQITKYNLNEQGHYDVSSQSGKKILVIGQCEDDASILYGSPHIKLNTELIEQAIQENPEATIYFRPHPDVTAGLRDSVSDVYSVSPDVVILDQPFDLWGNIDHFETIYVLTSLAGFEAAMRGCHVRVFGHPFYSGWGITQDEYPHPRRDRELTVEAVFYAAYMHLTHYIHPKTTMPITLDEAIDILQVQKGQR